MDAADLHVVLGAAGGMGSAVVEALAAAGKRVRAVQRRAGGVPAGVEVLSADVADPEGATRACAGAAVVYHCANAPYHRWPQLLLPLTRAVIEGAARAGARLVVGDNLYAYGPVAGPMTEDSPPAARTRKGRLRARSAAELLEAHRAGRVRAVIGRASDFYGPRANSTAGDWLFGEVLAGKPAPWLVSLDQPHTMSYLPDVGRGLALLGEHEEADGGVWHVPADVPLTGRAFLTQVLQALGRPARMTAIGRPMLALAGLFSPDIRETLEMIYEWDRPFVMDDARFRRAFPGFSPTPHAEAIPRTARWYQERAARA